MVGKSGARCLLGVLGMIGVLNLSCSSGSSTPDLDDINLRGIGGVSGIGTKTAEDILKELFPELTSEEIHALAADLSIDAAVSLKAELESIRKEAERFSRELFMTAEERVAQRNQELQPENAGFPKTLEPVGRAAFYSSAKGEGSILLSGIFGSQGKVELASANVSVSVSGAAQTTTLDCLRQSGSVDIVFLVDITGSMSPVIRSVRNSIARFVDAIVASGLKGTIGVVTFQDTVGVNVSFQQASPGVERSPFLAPVPIADAAQVSELQRFISRLEANAGADAPENLGAAVDFARNNVIGYDSAGNPNVIGEASDDPKATQAFPTLRSERQVFVAFTDVSFHSDSRTSKNSSLKEAFKPRKIADIVESLQASGTVVHVSDPSWRDQATTPTGKRTSGISTRTSGQ